MEDRAYLHQYDESSERGTARQRKVAEAACYRLERTLMGCVDPLLRGSVHPTSVLELTNNEVGGWGVCDVRGSNLVRAWFDAEQILSGHPDDPGDTFRLAAYLLVHRGVQGAVGAGGAADRGVLLPGFCVSHVSHLGVRCEALGLHAFGTEVALRQHEPKFDRARPNVFAKLNLYLKTYSTHSTYTKLDTNMERKK